jgi:hypothetical protein
MAIARPAGRVFFPLDEQLGIEGLFSGGIVRDCVLLGSLLPYERAAQSYAR